MPIAPQPHTFACPECGWTKIVRAKSDALLPGDHFHSCPECGCAHLVYRPVTAVRGVIEAVFRTISRRFG